MPERHLEYLNYNSTINYPLHENVLPSDIPKDFFVDISILVPETIALPIFISMVYLTSGTVAVKIDDSDSNTIGMCTSPVGSDVDYFSTNINPVEFDTVSGTVTFGPGVKRMISENLVGRYELDRSQGELETSCLIFTTTRFVKSILVDDTYFYGDVKFEAGDNIKLEYSGNDILISITNPGTFTPECYIKNDCYPSKCKGILQINNVYPDVNGNIILEGDGLTLFQNIGGKLVLNTPKFTPYDICNNYTQGAPGEPGSPGSQGPSGASGSTICEEDDCLHIYPNGDPDCKNFT